LQGKLFITEKPSRGYVSQYFTQTAHLADRTQAAVFAWREGLFEKRDNTMENRSGIAGKNCGIHLLIGVNKNDA
jgi:hypothetical protein